jgi:hypothetical protein
LVDNRESLLVLFFRKELLVFATICEPPIGRGRYRSRMSGGVGTTESTSCWQCGAPADEACTYIRTLSIPKARHADAQGFPVTRGWQSDTVRIAVPRCARCQGRNWIVGIVIGVATMIGAVFGGTEFPSRGWTTIVGGFGTLLPLWLGVLIYEKRAGLRNVDSYPPVRRFREAGWSDPV